jgi:hypothetical protein
MEEGPMGTEQTRLRDRAKDLWNAGADEYNKWTALGEDEKQEIIEAVKHAENMVPNRHIFFREKEPSVGWKSPEEALPPPSTPVLIRAENCLGSIVLILGEWCPAMTKEGYDWNLDDEYVYDEDTGTYYCPEGWYERWVTHPEITANRLHPSAWTVVSWREVERLSLS